MDYAFRPKVILALTLLLGFSIEHLPSQSAEKASIPETRETVLELGQHHALVEFVTQEKTNRYTVLGTGLNYWSAGENRWVASESRIETDQQGPFAVRAPLKVRFPAQLNTPGGLAIETPGGTRLSGHFLAVAYFDPVSGGRAWVSLAQASVPNLQTPGQVTYENALQNLDADVRFVFTPASLEQDVVFFQAPPAPATFELPNDSSYIQVWSEWMEAPEPRSEVFVLSGGTEGPDGRIEPEWLDHSLELGDLKFVAGSAFAEPDQPESTRIAVGKEWLRDPETGRQFLIESVPYALMKAQFDRLPQQAAVKQGNRKVIASRLPPTRIPLETAPAMLLSRNEVNRPRAIIDWKTVWGSMSGYRFQTANTFLITNTVFLIGTNYIEGNSVIKFSGASAQIDACAG